jgi:hypothetical protein
MNFRGSPACSAVARALPPGTFAVAKVFNNRANFQVDALNTWGAAMIQQVEDPRSEAITGSQADKARAGVIGHNVRYVLGFSLAGIILAFAVVGFLFSHGWLGTQ